jgi:hypothetical protein
MVEGFGSGRPKNMWIQWIRIQTTVDDYAHLAAQYGRLHLQESLRLQVCAECANDGAARQNGASRGGTRQKVQITLSANK